MIADRRPSLVSLALGGLALALILGALGFQYIGGYPPCELCHWQRWPLIAAAIAGLGGGMLLRRNPSGLFWLAVFCIVMVAASGALGAYHAGVEWHWWRGPQACSGPRFDYRGTLDLNAHVVACDIAAWRLLGISLAGYNALVSLGAAAIGAAVLIRKGA